MYELILSCEDLGRHEQMATTDRLLNARMVLWVQVHHVTKRFGEAVEMREGAWIDPDGVVCEGVEWVQRHRAGQWSSLFRLYVREQPHGAEPVDGAEMKDER